jgi:hypothetical protein
MASFDKNRVNCQHNSLEARIADSSSRKALSFSSGVHNEALSVVAMRVSNPDCSPLRING